SPHCANASMSTSGSRSTQRRRDSRAGPRSIRPWPRCRNASDPTWPMPCGTAVSTFPRTPERMGNVNTEREDLRTQALRAGLSAYLLEEEDHLLLDEDYDPSATDPEAGPAPVLAVVGRPNVGK